MSVRLWLTEADPTEGEYLSKRRSLLKPQLDQQSGNYYVELKGHDAFSVARLVPSPLIQFVTARHVIDGYQLPEKSAKPGVYIHGNVEVILERNASDAEIYVTGGNIVETQEAYNLYREGMLLGKYFEVQCPGCRLKMRTGHSVIKKKPYKDGSSAEVSYINCLNCGKECIIEVMNDGRTKK